MAITNSIDFVVTYDQDRLVTCGRCLSTSAPVAREHAAQCLLAEILRDILATGITVDEWNAMGQPEPWETWIAARAAGGLERAKLNVAAPVVPLLDANERASALGTASTIFETGYTAYMATVSQENKVTYTRTGGI
jgi:hypothetical protein